MSSSKRFAPGSTIGILGGGQLGRMFALAASRLGYKTHVYCPEAGCPTSQVTDQATIEAYDNQTALASFAEAVDVVTYEFENIPDATVELLNAKSPVRPNAEVLHTSQDRLFEKKLFLDLGLETAPFADIATLDDLKSAVSDIGLPAILKTRRFGYDGKGQVKITDESQIEQAFADMAGAPVILEGFVSFESEISVLIAQSPAGEQSLFPIAENVHKNHILDTSTVPTSASQKVVDRALDAAKKIAAALKLEGLLAVEMFVTNDDRVIINEIAPRPHNSGHWSMDGCQTDQFEQAVRAVCNLPLGDTSIITPTKMKNLIGDEADDWAAYLAEPNAKLHLYGKAESRPGRKMGHVNYLLPKRD